MRPLLLAAAAVAFILPVQARGQVKDATADETGWFDGRWALTPAPIEGWDTIPGQPPSCDNAVDIETAAPNLMHRTSTLRNGKIVTVTFRVGRSGEDFPLSDETGAGQVALARRIDSDTFDLAALDPSGQPDWNRGWRHLRCPLDPAAPE